MFFRWHFSILATLCLPLALEASNCRCFPGDDCWPSEVTWQQFNSSIDGKLIRTLPVAAVCHEPDYNAEECEALRKTWQDPVTHYRTTHSPMQPFWANQSCDPFSDPSAQCIVGAYIQYAVKISVAEDVQKTIQFCKEHNIRLVIRNTGHDYLGKSTGPGALAIWMHNLKDLEMVEWSDDHYNGLSLKLASGVQISEAMALAAEHGRTVVSGNCPTVGVAGGYIQGGGHSPLTSKFGLAADQTLEFEVIDGQGNYLVANRRENSNLYWALSGGGGGTYGVVLSVTVKTYPDIPTTMTTLQFGSADVPESDYWEAIASWNALLPSLYEAGCSAMWGWTREGIRVFPLTCPEVTADEVEMLLGPYLASLDELNIQHMHQVESFTKYSTWYNTTWSAMEEAQAGITQGGSWFIPESVVQDKKSNRVFIEAGKKIVDAGEVLFFLGFQPSLTVAGDVDNAVHPGWRDLAIDCIVVSFWNNTAPWSQMLADMEKTSTELIPLLQEVAPNAGTYMSEASYLDKDWKQNFYGPNYDKLLSIKQKYDADHVFYGLTAVGSDLWTEQVDGRLCKSESSQHIKDEL